MTIEDQIEGSYPSIVQGGIKVSGQTIAGGGHVPKIRKPYTITKQRERWTEEEHGKFLEALKLYGRAWRKIEEHVGTKTAVQIRSHAQKFFSKVVRETNSGNLNSVKTIEIPPPRPKKKPMHPYPRKLALPNKTEMMVSLKDHPGRSISPNSSVDREHQSPTSVISAVVSDTSGSADSSSAPDGSSSPISCLPPEDANMQENPSQSDEPVSLKLELFAKINTGAREGSVEATSSKSLKLFGRIVMVKDDDCPDLCLDKLEPEEGSGSLVGLKPYPLGRQEVADIPMVNAQSLVEKDPCEVLPAAIGCVRADPSHIWTSYGGLTYPTIPFDNQLMRTRCSPVDGDVLQKDVSCTGSETESVKPPRGSWEAESQSSTLRSKSGGGNNNNNNNNQMRGFVPYKRWCVSAGNAQSCTITGGDDKEGQRSSSWLCL